MVLVLVWPDTAAVQKYSHFEIRRLIVVAVMLIGIHFRLRGRLYLHIYLLIGSRRTSPVVDELYQRK